MGYKALYRSYRPTTFKEVIGQKHVIQTLKNAIIEKRTSHAYVFSGLRGIGKTTIARILAKAVNCINPVDGEPCNECEHCKAINDNSTTDIVELDAASNNGVDEIRSLLEKVNFLPSFLTKKVYIIDEVHMLSTAAFNALLKTLEEPPAYVMFILATTEPHKIPMTILSRCQRFDFKQLTMTELTEELAYICEKEGISISDEALNGIAEAAEGGMRDALSILDQASVYADGEVSVEDVNSVTGNISNQKLIELIKSLNNNDATSAISIITDLLNMGKEVSRLTTCIIQFCRDLLLFKSVNESLNDKYIYTTAEFKELVEETDSKRLFYYIDVLVDVQNKIRFTNSQKIYLEVGLMKIVNSASEDIDLLGRIQAIEYRLNNGEGYENIDFGISNTSLIENRLSTLENKMKKLHNEIEKANIAGFEETVNSKINVLEEVISKVSALPNTIEERINILENRVEDIENGDFAINNNDKPQENNVPVFTNASLEQKVIKLEKEFNEFNSKNTALLTALVEDVENIKSNDTNSEVVESPVNNDEIILEIIEKITQIEEQLKQPLNNVSVSSTDIEQKITALNEMVSKLKTKVDTIYNKGYAEVSFGTLFDIDNNETSNNDLTNVVNELLNDFNQLKTEVEELKSNQNNNTEIESKEDQNFSLYNKDRETEEKLFELIQLVEQLQQKINEVPSNDNFDVVQNDSQLLERLEAIEEKLSVLEMCAPDGDNADLANSVKEIKTNYFILTQAITLMKEKYDNLQLNVNSASDEKVNELEQQVKLLLEQIEELKATTIKDGALAEVVGLVNELKTKVQELETAIENKAESVKPIVKEEPVVQEEKEDPIVEPKKEPEPIKSSMIEEDITAKVYDIKIIENILHESRLPECRNIKTQIMQAWSKLEDKVGGQLLYVAKILSNGLPVANGKTHLLIVYPSAQICNHIMDPKHYENAKEVLKVTLGKAFDFVALPDDTWKEKRLEYHNQFRIGDTYPKLSPITNPKLRVVIKKDQAKSEREIAIAKANDFFGEDE